MRYTLYHDILGSNGNQQPWLTTVRLVIIIDNNKFTETSK